MSASLAGDHLQQSDTGLLLRTFIACLALGFLLASGAAAHEGEGLENHNEPSVDDHEEAQYLNVTLVGSVQVEAPLDHASRKFFTTTDLYLAGNYAYLGSDNNKLHVIDISQPDAMRAVAQIEMPGPALDIKVDGNLAVVGVQGAENTKMGVVIQAVFHIKIDVPLIVWSSIYVSNFALTSILT